MNAVRVLALSTLGCLAVALALIFVPLAFPEPSDGVARALDDAIGVCLVGCAGSALVGFPLALRARSLFGALACGIPLALGITWIVVLASSTLD